MWGYNNVVHRSPRLQKYLSILSYMLGVLLLAGSTIFFVALGYGYKYDFKTGQLKKTGIIITNTEPDNARVSLNGKLLKKGTPSKITGLEPGNYNLKIEKPGFITWEKTVTVEPEKVTFANYVKLLPGSPKLETLVRSGQMSNLTSSPDGTNLAYVVTNGDKPGLWTYNLSNGLSQRIYPVRNEDLPKADGGFSAIAWSHDSGKIYFRLDKDGYSHMVVDLGDVNNPVSLTDLFKTEFTSLQWSSNDSRELYYTKDGSLFKVNFSERVSSATLFENVISFKPQAGLIYLVAKTSKGNSFYRFEPEGFNKNEIFQAVPESPSYTIDVVEYNRQTSYNLLVGSTSTLYRYVTAGAGNPSATVLGTNVTGTTHSFDGRFITYSNSRTLTVRDQEKKVEHAAFQSFQSNEDIVDIKWWRDPYHLIVQTSTRSYVMEFDGANSLRLNSTGPVFYSPATKKFYFIRTSNNQSQIISQSTTE